MGIDPGNKGGMVILSETSELLLAERMPVFGRPRRVNTQELEGYYRLALDGRQPHLTMEKTAPASKGANATRALAGQRGTLVEWARGLGLPIELVSPAAWSKSMLAGTSYKGHEQKKEVAESRAAELWPRLPMSIKADRNAFGDAALIAEFGRRKWLGQLHIK